MNMSSDDDRVEAALTAFLDELSRDTSEAPSTAEMAVRVSFGHASARRSSARWQILVAAAIVSAALVSVIVAGAVRRDDPRPFPPSCPLRAPHRPIGRHRQPLAAGASSTRSRWRRRTGVCPGPLTAVGPHMAHGRASGGTQEPSRGLVVFQGPGNVLPVTLADVAWPNGRPNATRVTDIAPDGSRVVLSVASSAASEMRCGDLFVLDATGSEISSVFRGAAGLVGPSVGFSPDSALLGIVATDERGDAPISVVHVVTPTGEAAIEPQSFPCADLRVVWAPTGHRLAQPARVARTTWSYSTSMATAEASPVRRPDSRPLVGRRTGSRSWSRPWTEWARQGCRSIGLTRAARHRRR